MKKTLSIYLSLSLALTPALANAQAAQDTERQEIAAERVNDADQILNKKEIKILSEMGKKISFQEALNLDTFLLDARADNNGILEAKKIKVDENEIRYAIAARDENFLVRPIRSAKDRITEVAIDLNKSAEENILLGKESLSSLNVSAKTVYTGLSVLSLLAAAGALKIASELKAGKLKNAKRRTLQIVSVVLLAYGLSAFAYELTLNSDEKIK